jgi:predicted trehalose synthase
VAFHDFSPFSPRRIHRPSADFNSVGSTRSNVRANSLSSSSRLLSPSWTTARRRSNSGGRGSSVATAHSNRLTSSADRLLDFFLLEKAFYEIEYEFAHRPDWLRVPLAGTWRIFSARLDTAG